MSLSGEERQPGTHARPVGTQRGTENRDQERLPASWSSGRAARRAALWASSSLPQSKRDEVPSAFSGTGRAAGRAGGRPRAPGLLRAAPSPQSQEGWAPVPSAAP